MMSKAMRKLIAVSAAGWVFAALPTQAEVENREDKDAYVTNAAAFLGMAVLCGEDGNRIAKAKSLLVKKVESFYGKSGAEAEEMVKNAMKVPAENGWNTSPEECRGWMSFFPRYEEILSESL